MGCENHEANIIMQKEDIGHDGYKLNSYLDKYVIDWLSTHQNYSLTNIIYFPII